MEHYCKNCEYPLEEDYKFCPECGQKAKDKLTIRVLFSNTISNYFSVDARFFASFLPLLFKPGYLPKKFVEGKRLTYLHPAQFYLFISVVFFFLLSFEARHQQEVFEESIKKGFDSVDSIDSNQVKMLDSLELNIEKSFAGKGVDVNLDVETDSITSKDKSDINFGFNRDILDSLIAINAPQEEKLKAIGYKEGQAGWKQRFYIQLLKFYEKKGGGILQAFYDSIPLALFVLLPIYALLLFLLFFKKGRFAVHLVFSFYFFSFLFTVFSILLLVNLIYPVSNWINWILICSTGIYLIMALMRFYEQGFGKIFLKTTILSFLYLLFIIPTSGVILAVVSFFIY